jgi:dephospho-CoA kinase
MLRIGLTGGIGSGKSTVARIFNVLGIPVYSSDDASKRLMDEDEELKTVSSKLLVKNLIQMVNLIENTWLQRLSAILIKLNY